MHVEPLIATVSVAFTAAWLLGLLTQRIGLSPIVGYLLAGLVIGPHTPGFVGDVSLIPQLAELGVILLMFGVGLHFRLKDLIAVRGIAIPGAVVQSLIATLASAAVFSALGWSLTAGLVLGMAIAVASTVVLIRVLVDSGRLHSPAGHAAVGWLIVEDILTVIVLVLIPAFSGPPAGTAATTASSDGWLVMLLIALARFVTLVAIVLLAGSRVVPWILVQVARLRSRELFTLTVLVLSIAVATGAAAFFGVSIALGAFLAGMVVAQSPVSQQAGADALPLRDAFAVLFFVSVGMLFDPGFLIEHPAPVLAGLAIVLIVKPLAALLIVAVLGYPGRTALTVAVGLAQIGEFSFILGQLARDNGLLPEAGASVLVACALVSITVNPLLFSGLAPMEGWLRQRRWLWFLLNARSERRVRRGNAQAIAQVDAAAGPLAVVIGYGPVGQQVERLLREAGRETVVIELNMDVVVSLNAAGRTAIFGDATRGEVLEQAGVEKASHVVLTTPGSADCQALIATAKALNPAVRIIVRTRYLRDELQARHGGADAAVVDEVESAVALSELVLAETGADPSAIRSEAERVRQELSGLWHV